MLDEQDATRLWQRLFRGQAITAQTLVEAESVVDNLRPESPLRLRFSQELEEIRAMHNGQKPEGKR